MKKYLIILLVLAFAVSMLFMGIGCKVEEAVPAEGAAPAEEESVEEDAPEDEETQVEEITLEFWHPFPTEDMAAIIQGTIDNFMAENPGITINVLPIEFQIYQNEKLPLAVGSDSPPDIFFTWGTAFNNELIANGFELDITDAIDPVKAGITPGALLGYTYNGKIYGAGHSTPSKLMIYNKEIFDQYNLEAPKTWDDLMDICKTLKENGVIPIAWGQKDKWSPVHIHSELIAQQVGNDALRDMFSEPNKLDNPEMVESLRVLKDLAQKGYFDPDALSYDDYESHAVFINGEAAMYWAGSWNYPEFLEALGNAPDFKKFEYGVFPLSGNEGDLIYIGVTGLSGSSKTKYPEVVKEFLRYWIDYENSMYLIENAFESPSSNIRAVGDSADTMDYFTMQNVDYMSKLITYQNIGDRVITTEAFGFIFDEYQVVMWDDDRTPEESAKYLDEEYAKLFDK